jgi:hypothetical protein
MLETQCPYHGNLEDLLSRCGGLNLQITRKRSAVVCVIRQLIMVPVLTITSAADPTSRTFPAWDDRNGGVQVECVGRDYSKI